MMDVAWAAAVLGTEFPCGCIQQDKPQLSTFHIPLGEPRALHMGVHSQPPILLTGTDVPSSHEGGLGNRILEADLSLFQVTQIHQSPMVATLDADSSAQDTGEAKSHQEPAATEEPKAHSGNEEL